LRFFEVNVLSGVRLTRMYLPGMLKEDWGRVIFISSESKQMMPTVVKEEQIALAVRWGRAKEVFFSINTIRATIN